MKVYQLMRALAEAPAGAPVVIALGENYYPVSFTGPRPDPDAEDSFIIVAEEKT